MGKLGAPISQGEFEAASQILSELIQEARASHERAMIRRIRRCWQYDAFGRGSPHGDKWATILRKIDTEGSVWVVWWYDGVRQFIRNQRRGVR